MDVNITATIPIEEYKRLVERSEKLALIEDIISDKYITKCDIETLIKE